MGDSLGGILSRFGKRGQGILSVTSPDRGLFARGHHQLSLICLCAVSTAVCVGSGFRCTLVMT